METLIQASYFIVAVIFIVGLKQMGSPSNSKEGYSLGRRRNGFSDDCYFFSAPNY